jgi:hypothetical protein
MRCSRPLVLTAASIFGVILASADTAGAQAWLPPRGEAALTLGLSKSWADHHIDYRGAAVSPGAMDWNNVIGDLSYGITDRLAVRVGVPFVISKYGGEFPHPALPGKVTYDDGSWHGTFQDLRAEVRFKAATGSLAITPLLAIVVPTTGYPQLGHSAAGRHLVEGQVGVNVGRLLDPVLPDAYLQARYTYTVPERPLGIAHDRSNVFLDMGYFVTPRLTLSALGAWQKTHGGWRAMIDFPPLTNPNFVFHDQLIRTDYFRLGSAASFALTGSVDVGVTAYRTLSARSDVNMSGVSLSMSYGFSPAQIIKRNKGVTPSK